MTQTRPTPAPATPPRVGLPRVLVHAARALRLRCPHCGGGPLFRRWVRMRDTCPRCHLVLDRREPDYFLGGYVVNFVGAELMIAAIALGAILMTWPAVPWTPIKWSLLVVMVPFPLVTYPWAKTLWLGIDLTLRPPTLADFAGHGENAPPEAAPPELTPSA
ncbi:MAG: DUF983 domain-containing protein [Longimicrobiales bacterium]|nr:DUF983 domain-containing protein [Longimicrobiales bacterium]